MLHSKFKRINIIKSMTPHGKWLKNQSYQLEITLNCRKDNLIVKTSSVIIFIGENRV